MRKKTHYLVQAVGEGIIGAWRSANDLPIIDNEFVTSRCSLAFRHGLESTNELDG